MPVEPDAQVQPQPAASERIELRQRPTPVELLAHRDGFLVGDRAQLEAPGRLGDLLGHLARVGEHVLVIRRRRRRTVRETAHEESVAALVVPRNRPFLREAEPLPARDLVALDEREHLVRLLALGDRLNENLLEREISGPKVDDANQPVPPVNQ